MNTFSDLSRRVQGPTALFALCAVLLSTPLASQAAPSVRRFTTADARFPEGFTLISSVRELPNGQVVVSDRREQTLQRLDFASGSAEPVGRSGAGPREWGVPGRLMPLRGDTTVMEDFINARLFLVNPDGSPGETFRIPESSPANFGTLIGADAQGRLIVERPRVDAENPMGGSIGIVDILRYDRVTNQTDTIGQRGDVQGENSGARQLPGGFLQSFTNLPLAPRDAALVTSDGRTVVVRHSPYVLEVIAPESARRRGPSADAPVVRVTQAEKEAFVRAQIRPGSIIVRQPAGGSAVPRTGSLTGPSSSRPVPPQALIAGALDNPNMTWPALKPPFIASSALAGPDGTVWVQRSRAHDDNVPVYDVFGTDGRVTHRVALPVGARLVGFGKGVAYLVTSDADDLQYLERHKLP
jgi:hypothetical protein